MSFFQIHCRKGREKITAFLLRNNIIFVKSIVENCPFLNSVTLLITYNALFTFQGSLEYYPSACLTIKVPSNGGLPALPLDTYKGVADVAYD